MTMNGSSASRTLCRTGANSPPVDERRSGAATAATGRLELAVGGELHDAGIEAQLHVFRVAEHALVGELDADEVLRFRALAEEALRVRERADLLHRLLQVGARGELGRVRGFRKEGGGLQLGL